MKKYLLIFISAISFSQAPSRFSNVQITGNAEDNTAKWVNVQTESGIIKKILKSSLVPQQYTNIVYVNATSPTGSTIFDLNNPPVTNDNMLKATSTNLYIGTDGSTWNFNTLSGNYTTYTVPKSSNFNLSGTSIDAGNDKTSAIVRSGTIESSGFKKTSGTATQSLQADGSVYDLNLKQNYLSWKSPQDYGAVGDGIADDTQAIRDCLLNNLNVFFFGQYKTTNFLQIRQGQKIYSNNATINRLSGNSATFIALNVQDWQIDGKLTIIGSGKSVGVACGLKIVGCSQFDVRGLTVQDMSGYGIKIEPGLMNLPRGRNGLFVNCFLINNYVGLESNHGSQGEYHSMVNINATSNDTAIIIESGNMSITGGNIVDNNLGLYIGGNLAINGAHGIISGVNINHNALNLKTLNIDLGETFSGCHFYGDASGSIKLDNSRGVSFSNCIIDGKIESIDGVGNIGANYFYNCQMAPDVVVTQTTKLIFNNCFRNDNTVFSGNSIASYSDNHSIGQSFSDYGNFQVAYKDIWGINKGGVLSLSGSFGSGGADPMSQASFAKIHGKKENVTAGNVDGYMAFEVSNSTTAPYSREVGRFSSLGNFTVLGKVTAAPAVLDTELATLGQVKALTAASGTYTPVILGTTNITSSTVVSGYYTKIGKIVTVYVSIYATSTASLTETELRVTRPISAKSSNNEPTGNGTAYNVSPFDGGSPIMIKSYDLTKVDVYFKPKSAGNLSVSFNFSYEVN